MKSVFFYGLFMDQELLKGKGFSPSNSKHAYLLGYRLRIGARATLVPHSGARSYGTVMELENRELEDLYGSDGVEDYVSKTVKVNTISGELLEAITYILPTEKTSEINSEYAVKLSSTAKKLNLPASYIKEIEAWIKK